VCDGLPKENQWKEESSNRREADIHIWLKISKKNDHRSCSELGDPKKNEHEQQYGARREGDTCYALTLSARVGKVDSKRAWLTVRRKGNSGEKKKGMGNFSNFRPSSGHHRGGWGSQLFTIYPSWDRRKEGGKARGRG